jgi:dTDP-4-dehydrorhamnose 3,5-epimerase
MQHIEIFTDIRKNGLTNDLVLFTPKVFKDPRGYFYESYNKAQFNELMQHEVNFVQDNISLSANKILRGLHFQTGDMAQDKYVACLQGYIIDVVVDLRNDSPTFGKSWQVHLNQAMKQRLWVPKGFAHSFLVTSPEALVQYKCTNPYSAEHDGGVHWKSKELHINWYGSNWDEFIVSDKDANLPDFDPDKKYFSID